MITEQQRQSLLQEQKLLQEKLSLLQRQTDIKESNIPKLLEQMQGRMPSKGPIYQTGGMIAGAGPVTGPSNTLPEQQRRSAYKQLTDSGYTDPQIKLLLDTKNADTPKVLGQSVGGMAGSIAIPAIVGQIPPFTALPEEAVTIPLSLAIFGAGAGGAAGKTAQTLIQEKRLPEAGEVLKAGGSEMAYEGGGWLAFKGLKMAFSPFIKKTMPEAAALIDDFATKSGHFTPGQLDKRWTLQTADEIARGAFVSKKIMSGFDEMSQARIILYADDVVESMGEGFSRNPTEAGEMLLDMIARPGAGGESKGKILKSFDDLVRPLYAQVDEMTKGTLVSTKGLKDYAEELLAKDERLKSLYLSPKGRSSLKKITQLDPYVKFSDIQDLRSSFLADVRKLSRDADKADAILKQIAKLSDEAIFEPTARLEHSWKPIRIRNDYYKMRLPNGKTLSGNIDVMFHERELDLAKKMGSGVLNTEEAAKVLDDFYQELNSMQLYMSNESQQLLRNTNALYKTGREVLENTFPYKLAKQMAQNPEKAVKLFKPGDVQGIRNLRRALTIGAKGRPNAQGKIVWNQLRQQWLAQTIDASITNNQINRKTFERLLNKMGTNALKEMYGPEELARVNKITNLLDVTQKTGTSGTTLISKSLQIAGASAALYKLREGELVGATASGAIALSPIAYALLATNPKGAKLLLAGIRIPPGSERLGPLAARMINVIRQIRAERIRADKKALRLMQARQQTKLESQALPSVRPVGGRHF